MAKKEIRPIRIEGNVAYVPLTQGYEAIIDAADVPLVDGVNWFSIISRHRDGTHRTVYGGRNEWLGGGKQAFFYLHRVVAGTPTGFDTDHINGDGLDNRRSNLRIATKSENNCNQRLSKSSASGVKGVSWDKDRAKWAAHIKIGGKMCHLGRYASLQDAADRVASERRKLHGTYARIG